MSLDNKTLYAEFQVTPVVALSNESWSMSFAKYLELRFYGHQYTRRANAEPCGHSIHHDYHQYFSYNQMVASFRWEVRVHGFMIYSQHNPSESFISTIARLNCWIVWLFLTVWVFEFFFFFYFRTLTSKHNWIL